MPKFTREQVRARQITCGVALAVIVLILVGSCVALLTSKHAGGASAKKPFEVHVADPEAMHVTTTPSNAPAVAQLGHGITLASGETAGIDVANHEGDIDWKKVAADGYTFAYIKATEGKDYVDPYLSKNWDGAKANGITPGAYHYFTLCSTGAEQARDFLAAVPVSDAVLPPAIDLELDGACKKRPASADVNKEVDTFMTIVEAKWGRKMVVYSSNEWRVNYGLSQADGRPTWPLSSTARPAEANWAVWQLHFEAKVPGIDHPTDIDVARIEELRARSAMTAKERAALSKKLEAEAQASKAKK